VAADTDKLDEILALLQEIRAGLNGIPRAWLSPEEAAVYLGVSRSRIYQYIRADKIPFHRLPDSNLIRFSESELDEWVRNGRRATGNTTDETIRRLLE